MIILSKQDLDAIVAALRDSVLRDPALVERLKGPPGDQGAQGSVGNAGDDALIDTRWRIEEFGLFEPDLIIDDRHPDGDIITVGRDTIYRNIDTFCERIKDTIATKGADIVKENLHLYLRGYANRWWTFEQSDLDKQAMRSDISPNLAQWTGRLQIRFRPRMTQASRENSELKFSIADIRAGKKVLTYFQSKILRARAAGFETV
jgi:hypothetical protein